MRRALLCAALLATAVSCGKDSKTSDSARPTETPAPSLQPERPRAIDASVPVDAAAAPQAKSPIPASSQQLVVSVSDEWQSATVRITRFERDAGGEWQRVGESFDAAIGAAGMGWGRGLHPDVALADEPTKKEGDKRSPAGLFGIGSSYGYGDALPVDSGIHYTQSNKTLRCVDDASSAFYNRIIDEALVNKDWESAEFMKPRHPLYEMLVTIDHNELVPSKRSGTQAAPVAGAGSCVFFHLWRKLEKPTLGCTAMSRDSLVELIGWLDGSKDPVALFLPRGRYSGLQSEWALPSL